MTLTRKAKFSKHAHKKIYNSCNLIVVFLDLERYFCFHLSGIGWRAAIWPADHPVANFEFDVVVGADGRRNTLEGEEAGKLERPQKGSSGVLSHRRTVFFHGFAAFEIKSVFVSLISHDVSISP